MIAFLGDLPTGAWFLILLAFFWGLTAFGYFLGIEVGQERGFKLGYARGKLVGTQETNHFYASYLRDGEVDA
jgi:hypothetical protein